MSNLLMRIIKKTRSFGKENASHFDEANIIKKYLGQLENVKNYCVDIAASDGVSMSNTYNLFKNGWSGIAVEFDARKFAKLSSTYSAFENSYLVKTRVTP